MTHRTWLEPISQAHRRFRPCNRDATAQGVNAEMGAVDVVDENDYDEHAVDGVLCPPETRPRRETAVCRWTEARLLNLLQAAGNSLMYTNIR